MRLNYYVGWGVIVIKMFRMYFDNAIQLFTEIEAPLRVERVRKSIINK